MGMGHMAAGVLEKTHKFDNLFYNVKQMFHISYMAYEPFIEVAIYSIY